MAHQGGCSARPAPRSACAVAPLLTPRSAVVPPGPRSARWYAGTLRHDPLPLLPLCAQSAMGSSAVRCTHRAASRGPLGRGCPRGGGVASEREAPRLQQRPRSWHSRHCTQRCRPLLRCTARKRSWGATGAHHGSVAAGTRRAEAPAPADHCGCGAVQRQERTRRQWAWMLWRGPRLLRLQRPGVRPCSSQLPPSEATAGCPAGTGTGAGKTSWSGRTIRSKT